MSLEPLQPGRARRRSIMKRYVVVALSLVLAAVKVPAQDGGYCSAAPKGTSSAFLTSESSYADEPRLMLPFCEGDWYISYRPPGDHKPSDAALDFNMVGPEEQQQVVRASAPGTVVTVGHDCSNSCSNPAVGSYGEYVRLDHGNGYKTIYAHMACGSISVQQGDVVARGQGLGVLGNTGSSCGAHLHFDYQRSGVYLFATFDEVGLLDGRESDNPYVGASAPYMTGSNCGDSVTPEVHFSRAYAHGAGTANGLAWVQGVKESGDTQVVGLGVEPPHWQNNFVVQKSCRLTDGVCNLLVHDEKGFAPRALSLIDAFWSAFESFGGFATFDAPLSRKYQLPSGAWRQDFWRGYIVIDESGAHQYRYPAGIEPGEGGTYKTPFRVAYGELGGDNAIGNPSKTVQSTGGYEWQEYKSRDGRISRLYAAPDALRAFWIQGAILDWYKANNTVFQAGPPISDEFSLADGKKKQYFRYGAVVKNTNGVVSYTKSGTRQYAPGDGMSQGAGVLIRDAFERNGSYRRLGVCGAPTSTAGHLVQYCAGGDATGRALLALNAAESARMAFATYGGIEAAYSKSGGLAGTWGYPISDRYDAGLGQQQAFQRVSVDWYNNTAHVDDWVDAAPGEGSGYATAFRYLWQLDLSRSGQPRTLAHWWEYTPQTAVIQEYEGGDWKTPVTFIHDEMQRAPRAFLLRGGMRDAYLRLGGPTSQLGKPVSDIIISGKNAVQYFEYGYLAGNTDVADYDLHMYQ